jgi:hypothetical protein
MADVGAENHILFLPAFRRDFVSFLNVKVLSKASRSLSGATLPSDLRWGFEITSSVVSHKFVQKIGLRHQAIFLAP